MCRGQKPCLLSSRFIPFFRDGKRKFAGTAGPGSTRIEGGASGCAPAADGKGVYLLAVTGPGGLFGKTFFCGGRFGLRPAMRNLGVFNVVALAEGGGQNRD